MSEALATHDIPETRPVVRWSDVHTIQEVAESSAQRLGEVFYGACLGFLGYWAAARIGGFGTAVMGCSVALLGLALAFHLRDLMPYSRSAS